MNPFLQLDIPKRSLACEKGGERLTPGTEYFSLITDGENDTIVRHDFCSKCWIPPQVDKKQTYWKSSIEAKTENLPGSQSRIEKALTLLKKLLLEPQGKENEIFVLAIYLAHARKLTLRKEFEEQGIGYSLYEIMHQDEFVTIKRVDLSLLETTALQKTLSQQLLCSGT